MLTYSARPLGMLVGVDMVLRVRHQAKDIAPGVADAGYVQNGAIWVGGIYAVCRGTVCVGVDQGDLLVFDEGDQRETGRGLKVAFAMCNGAFDQFIR